MNSPEAPDQHPIEAKNEPLFIATIHRRSSQEILEGAKPFEMTLKDRSGLVIKAEGSTEEEAQKNLEDKRRNSLN